MVGDPLSATASIVGIAAATLHTVRLLLKDIDSIRNAPKFVNNLRTRIASIKRALEYVQDIGEDVSNAVEEEIIKCREVCNKLQLRLKDSTSLRYRVKVGIIDEHAIEKLVAELEWYKNDLTLAVTIYLA
jgi:hypothetical protein